MIYLREFESVPRRDKHEATLHNMGSTLSRGYTDDHPGGGTVRLVVEATTDEELERILGALARVVGAQAQREPQERDPGSYRLAEGHDFTSARRPELKRGDR